MRSLRIQAHWPLCKQHLINSRYHCNIQNGSTQENGSVVLDGGRKPFYHMNSGSNPSCLSVLRLVTELQDGSLCPWHSQSSRPHINSPAYRYASKAHRKCCSPDSFLRPARSSQHHAGHFCPQIALVSTNPEQSCIFLGFSSTKVFSVTWREKNCFDNDK